MRLRLFPAALFWCFIACVNNSPERSVTDSAHGPSAHVISTTPLYDSTSADKTLAYITERFIDPTGTYALATDTTHWRDEVIGCYGEIRAALIDSTHVAMSFYYCKGAPGYNSGSFVDTLDYDRHNCIYRCDGDSSTKGSMGFAFSPRGVWAGTEGDAAREVSCFGYGVTPDGFFYKRSSRRPTIKDPLISD